MSSLQRSKLEGIQGSPEDQVVASCAPKTRTPRDNQQWLTVESSMALVCEKHTARQYSKEEAKV